MSAPCCLVWLVPAGAVFHVGYTFLYMCLFPHCSCDNCPAVSNPQQRNIDKDTYGDVRCVRVPWGNVGTCPPAAAACCVFATFVNDGAPLCLALYASAPFSLLRPISSAAVVVTAVAVAGVTLLLFWCSVQVVTLLFCELRSAGLR